MQTTLNSTKAIRLVAGLALVAAVTGAVVVLLWRVAADVARDAVTGVPLTADRALLGLLAFVGVVTLSRLAVGVVLEALAALPGALGRVCAALADVLAPRAARRVAAVVLGVSVGAGAAAGPAGATPQDVVAVADHAARTLVGAPADAGPSLLPDPGFGVSPSTPDGTAAPDPGWTPQPPRVRPQPDVTTVGGRPPRDTLTVPEVVVRRGDSLWSIAARHLGEGATDAEVAAAWPRWYAVNEGVVGPDPDLLLPGQVLRAPADPAVSS